MISLIASAQQPDGYLNCHFTVVEPDKRWTNLRDQHELYCAGHLIEAAVAHFQATGKRKLLDVLCRYADYIDSVFGPEPGKKHGYCGHEEIELALVKLYHVTGEERYLRLSRFFIEERGSQPHYYHEEARLRGDDPKQYENRTYEYFQAQKPVREHTVVEGHAVRAMYLYSAVADLAREFQDAELLAVCERLWKHLTGKRMYITGGIGSTGANEGFTFDYDLPNETAYAETCAAIGLILWAHRMLQFDCDSRYADVMERALYNGFPGGVSLDGEKFFYVNPLASLGNHQRQDWFGCACCPTNVVRTIASISQYIYSRSETDAAVHLYVRGTGQFEFQGETVTLLQDSNYPWDGRIAIEIKLVNPVSFGLRLRIPSWAREAHLRVNGEPLGDSGSFENGYLRIERTWNDGDRVELGLPMPVEQVHAHPGVRQDIGCIALQRGPVVYCLEEQDNPYPLHQIVIPAEAQLVPTFEKDLLGGVVVLTGEVEIIDDSGWDDILYSAAHPKTRLCQITAIPYCTWANRQPGQMSVWIREE